MTRLQKTYLSPAAHDRNAARAALGVAFAKSFAQHVRLALAGQGAVLTAQARALGNNSGY